MRGSIFLDKQIKEQKRQYLIIRNLNQNSSKMMLQEALVQEIRNFVPAEKAILSTQFVLYMDDKIYQNTQAFLFSDHIVLKLNAKKGSPHLKIDFNFDLVFDLERFDDQKNSRAKLGHPHTLKFERYNQSLALKNSNSAEQLFHWRNFLGRKLNQRGFHELFKPIKKVGKGNFASVYLVIKYEDGKKYAVKAFSKQGTFSQDKGKQSLINEIDIMREFDHKNLMKLYDIYESQNSIYVCVQLLEGGQLYDKIKNKHKFSMDETKAVMKGIILGLEAMHAKNIMHRDLKPQNILFRKQGDFDCVIADFGLSTKTDQEEYLFVRCGTPGYVAPEIVNLKDLKAKYSAICDMFSLGVIFHLLLLRKSPFPGKQYDEVLSQNRACKFNFESSDYKAIPQLALDLLKRLLEKDPAKRINASDALQHQFFGVKVVQQTINSPTSTGIRQRPPSLVVERQNNHTMQCDSPLMTTKNQARKQGARLRDDSCLKFKMKQNILMGRGEESGQTIEHIDSPAVLAKRGPKVHESRFKRLVQHEDNE